MKVINIVWLDVSENKTRIIENKNPRINRSMIDRSVVEKPLDRSAKTTRCNPFWFVGTFSLKQHTNLYRYQCIPAKLQCQSIWKFLIAKFDKYFKKHGRFWKVWKPVEESFWPLFFHLVMLSFFLFSKLKKIRLPIRFDCWIIPGNLEILSDYLSKAIPLSRQRKTETRRLVLISWCEASTSFDSS